MGGGRLPSTEVNWRFTYEVDHWCASGGMMGWMKLDDGDESKTYSKKSPTGPTERTPKPEYLIALVTYLGVRW